MRLLVSEDDGIKVDKSLIADMENAAKIAIMVMGRSNKNVEVSLTITNNEKIHELNYIYRNIDRPTDVLSFATTEGVPMPVFDDQPLMLGDIVISVDKVRQQAEEFGHSFRREMVFLMVHGMLHLLGLDHMEEEDRIYMEAKQDQVMALAGISRKD